MLITSKKKLLFFIVALTFFSVSFAQPNTNCSCHLLLKEAVEKVQNMYAGYTDKVNSQSLPEYQKLINYLDERALHANGDRDCYEIIKKYTDWFEDDHVGIWFGVATSADKIRRISIRSLTMTNDSVKNDIKGIWESADLKEKLAIIRDPLIKNEYVAVAIKTEDSAWQPGMVKAEIYYFDAKRGMYRGMFYQKDFKGKLDGFTVHKNRMDHWFGHSWYREGTVNDADFTGTDDVQFKVLNKDFDYLKLGHFNNYPVDKLDSFIKANRAVIYSTKNLIIDLRGNPGGNTNSSQEMIQLIYTNPIIYPAWQYRSSPELIAEKKTELTELINQDPYHRLNDLKTFLKNLEDHPGELVSTGDSIVRKSDSISAYPERVAFLIDNGTASSSEFFIFEGKQSRKVTLFGTHSAGVMDYGDAHSFPLSCGEYLLGVAWGRNGWIKRFGFHMNNVGFMPDVKITSNETDWIQFVVRYWSK